MESLLISIDPREPLWLGIAFLFGFAVRQVGLPPLVGFLAAGFLLHFLGASGGEFLNEVADLGVTLLLFTIGLKLRLRELVKPEIVGVGLLHMLVVTLGVATIIWLLAASGLPLVTGLGFEAALLLGFAVSFSSTVFAVKVLEDKGDVTAQYGRLAVGVLIVQDVAAVIFLAASAGKLPSPWAVLVLAGLILARPILAMILHRAGHGELLILYGIALALGAATVFELVSLKGDLGALALGILLAGHRKAPELAKSLLGFKDLFLIGFFLSIGMAGLPDGLTLVAALGLLLIVPLKVALYFLLFSRFRVRARTATLASLGLANFSEFGLIVEAIAAANGWLPQEWLVVIALALALSFVLAAPLNQRADDVYLRWRDRLLRFEHRRRLRGEEAIQLGTARVAIFGMGRIGTGAYDAMRGVCGEVVIGFDHDEAKVAEHQAAGRRTILGDPANPDFWERIEQCDGRIQYALLCMASHQTNLAVARHMREWGFRGRIAATTKFADEAADLQHIGVDAAFNIYAEAGAGFAEHVRQQFSIDRCELPAEKLATSR